MEPRRPETDHRSRDVRRSGPNRAGPDWVL